MSIAQLSSRRQAEEMLITKAQQDSAFRAELLANPRAAIGQHLGLDLPSDLKITVVEENPRSLFLVLPAVASNEMSEQELAGVVGGKLKAEAESLAHEANDAGKFSQKGPIEDAAKGHQQQF